MATQPSLFPRVIMIYLKMKGQPNEIIQDMVKKLSEKDETLESEKNELARKLSNLPNDIMKGILDKIIQSDDGMSILQFMASQSSIFLTGLTFTAFYHGPCRYDGRDQQMAIFLLHLHLLHKPSNGPIRAKQINPSSAVIGRQY
jgi:hypothetical protein